MKGADAGGLHGSVPRRTPATGGGEIRGFEVLRLGTSTLRFWRRGSAKARVDFESRAGVGESSIDHVQPQFYEGTSTIGPVALRGLLVTRNRSFFSTHRLAQCFTRGFEGLVGQKGCMLNYCG